ncbi:MAG: tripartite tricarboxylate transporter substrate binding protein [Burkholderiales bacterium]|nr:tripartite tricarboxylate transporter substrate binding protein [Burkholderiales bacterium]
MNKRRFLRASAAVAAGLAGMRAATAQQAPALKLIVGFPPGGSGDTFARLIAEQLRPDLGTVVIENREGAGGLVAAEAFLRAPADGYTAMMHTASSAVFAPLIRKKPPYDPLKDFQWVALMSVAPLVLVAHPGLPVADLKSLLAHLRARPGQPYGSAGIGASTHLAAELLFDTAGVKMLHVPYKGSAPSITDTIGGNVTCMLETLQTTYRLHAAGKLRIVAVLGESRLPGAPEIPTAREQGVDVIASTYNLLALPVQAPAERAAALARALGNAMRNPEFQKRLVADGLQPLADVTPERTRAFVAAEVARWAPVARRLGIEL